MDTKALAQALAALQDAGTSERIAFETLMAVANDPQAIKLQGVVWAAANRAKLEAFRDLMHLVG